MLNTIDIFKKIFNDYLDKFAKDFELSMSKLIKSASTLQNVSNDPQALQKIENYSSLSCEELKELVSGLVSKVKGLHKQDLIVEF